MATIRELPVSMQPLHRMNYVGMRGLTDTEVLSLLLNPDSRSGDNPLDLAQKMLLQFDGLAGIAAATPEELCAMPTVGRVKAAQIQAGIEMGRRLLTPLPYAPPVIRSPADVANLLMAEMGLLEREELRVLVLDTKNNLRKVATVYQGSINSAVVRVAEVFAPAIRANAASIIVVHNHPSADPTPSPEDVATTSLLVDAGKMLDIAVLDHIILGRNRYVSLKERNLGFR